MFAARPAKRRSVSDSDVIVAGSAFYTASSSSVFACDRMLRDNWPVIDWREPIRLQERLKGRSSHNREILRDVSFPLSGNRGYDSNQRRFFPCWQWTLLVMAGLDPPYYVSDWLTLLGVEACTVRAVSYFLYDRENN